MNLGAVGKCQREEGGRRKGAGQSLHLCRTCQEPIGRDARLTRVRSLCGQRRCYSRFVGEDTEAAGL